MKPTCAKAIAVMLLLSFVLSGQNQNKDTSLIDAQNLNAWNIRNNDLELSRSMAIQAIEDAQKINYIRGLSYSYNILGHYNKVKGSYDTAFYYYQKSLLIRQKLNDTISMASSYRNIMSIYKLQGNTKKAINTGLKAILLLLPKSNNKKASKEKAWIQTNLSSIYLKTGEYKNAVKTALEAKSVFTIQNEEEGMAAAAMSLGNIYERLREYNKALIEFEEAIKISIGSDNQRELAKAYNNIGNVYYATDHYQEALASYKKGLDIRQLNGYNDDIHSSLYNIGVIYKSLDKADLAIHYYNKSLELCLKSGNIEGQYEANRAIGSVFFDQKKYDEAIGHFQKSLLLSSKTGSLPESLILLKEISNAYKASGKSDSALLYSDHYSALNDSLNEVLRSSITLEAEIKTQEYELNISKERNKSQMYIIIGLSSVIILMGYILFLFFRSFKAKKRMQHLQELIKEQELRSIDAMVEGQEAERKRLATELHDTIGSMLSATKYAFKSMESSLTKMLDENKTQFHKINTMLDEALESVRRISHDMASGVLLEKGIGEALSQLCDTIQGPGNIVIELHMYGFTEKTEYTIELNLYRIVQELLTNILKHSHAQQVNIQLIKHEKNINLVVDDDGKGFNPDSSHTKHGIGLLNIDKRVKALFGKWDIDSGKGKGTTVVIDIPVNDSNN